MYEFRETLAIEIPAVDQQFSAFLENEQENRGLIVEIAAIHEGLTQNFNFYSRQVLEESLETWVSPYPKPIIMNHDIYSDPIGRVMGAQMASESDGTPYTMLQVAITDPEAIAKVLDKRYLTGSVGGKGEEANCSVCGADWAKASMFEMPCKHRRGKTYDGKLAYIELKKIAFKEYSIGNVPADQRSGIRTVSAKALTESAGTDNGWVRSPARIFSLSMDKEEVLEFTESADRNIFAGMTKKESGPVYMQLKGAFLSALAVAETENDLDKESDVDMEAVVEKEEDEDILAVTDDLSSDLASLTSSSDADEVEEGEEEEIVAEEEIEEEEEISDDVSESDEEDEENVVEEDNIEEETVEEGDKAPEGQEKPGARDVDPETSAGAPVSREEDEETDENISEEDTTDEEEVAETDLNEEIEALESRVEALETRERDLLEENARLKETLKRVLAERVVEMKIVLGLADAGDRADLLDEHAKRSASSLADSLRDLSSMPVVRPSTESVGSLSGAFEETSGAVEDGEPTFDEEEDDEPDNQEEEGMNPEDVFVDILMGRRPA